MLNRAYLVDTSVWIFALRKQFDPFVREYVDQLLKDHIVLINGMIKLELLGGVKTEKEFKRLKSRLDALEKVEIDNNVWEITYQIAFNLRQHGVTVPYTDILIAASAIKSKAILVHIDKHFDTIARYTNLEVESLIGKLKTRETPNGSGLG